MSLLSKLTSALTGGGNTGVTVTTEPVPHATTGVITPQAITGNANGWTNSAYAQVTATTAANEWATHLFVLTTTTAGTEYEIDIGIGASGSENVVATIPVIERTISTGYLVELPTPIFIPASSRIAVRHRASAGSKNLSVVLICTRGLPFP